MSGIESHFEITLKPKKDGSTFILIAEKGRENDEEGITCLRSNIEGWANFMPALGMAGI